MAIEDVLTLKFEDDGRIPNNPDLPLVVYQDVLPDDDDMISACRSLFSRNGWGGIWVDGVFNYHHYHSTAHEVLGVVSGTAEIQFGGEGGQVISVRKKDVVIIPAGVGHCRISTSPHFQVVGAYPAGQDWDLRTGTPGERPEVLNNIRAVSRPESDPVFGSNGYLLELW